MFNDVESEIQDAIEDIRFGVKLVVVQQQNAKKILKITTLEDRQVFISISERGFEVCVLEIIKILDLT